MFILKGLTTNYATSIFDCGVVFLQEDNLFVGFHGVCPSCRPQEGWKLEAKKEISVIKSCLNGQRSGSSGFECHLTGLL